mmetsp:Transcript_29034/g.69370  ORF Transcript_29034/g.69370 Transcript_29034/m.69370 type:complete len:208 (-) Transcript_29034:236-859(-)
MGAPHQQKDPMEALDHRVHLRRRVRRLPPHISVPRHVGRDAGGPVEADTLFLHGCVELGLELPRLLRRDLPIPRLPELILVVVPQHPQARAERFQALPREVALAVLDHDGLAGLKLQEVLLNAIADGGAVCMLPGLPALLLDNVVHARRHRHMVLAAVEAVVGVRFRVLAEVGHAKVLEGGALHEVHGVFVEAAGVLHIACGYPLHV